MKKENQLILDLLHFSLDKKLKNKIKSSLKKELDWNYILQISRINSISPILYKNLKSLNFKNRIIEEFRNDYFSIYLRNIILYKELDKILKAFEKEGIEVIVLKGMYLAKYIYKDIGLRPMSDIDILVRKEDLPKIKKIIKRLNYTMPFKKDRSGKLHDFYFNFEKKIALEPHYNVAIDKEVFHINPNLFFLNKKNLISDKHVTYTLNSEYSLLFFCLHISKHTRLNEISLCWLTDILFFLKKEKLNFNKFKQIVKKLGVENHIYFIFLLYKKLLDPNFNLNLMPHISLINKIIIDYIISKKVYSIFKKNNDETRALIDFIFLKKNILKIKIIFKYFFPPRDQLCEFFAINKKNPLIYLLYFINPFRFSIKFGRLILNK